MKIAVTSIFFLFGLLFYTYSQSDTIEITISGSIIDAATLKGAQGVNVSVINTPIGTSTLMNGKFNLKVSLPSDSFPINLRFSHIAFETFNTSIGPNFNRVLEIKMTPKIQSMQVVDIYSGPRRIASPYFSEIIDYEILGENIVLLENLDKSRKNRVRIVDFYGNLLGETMVKGKPISLFKDCRDEVYLIMQDRYLKILHDIEVSATISGQNLENRIKNPCRVKTDSFLIYEEFGYARLMSWFLKRESNARQSSLFYFSSDRLTLNLIQEDLMGLRQKYGNIIQDLQYIEASLDNSEENRIRNLVLDEDLSQSLFYQPNYCPLFLEGKNILAFDHGNNHIMTLDFTGKILDKTKIKYHHKLSWQPEIHHDAKTNNYFTLMKKGGWITLYKIDPQTGVYSPFHKIENIFPEKIKLVNGYLLYLYRKPRTPDRYSLYLEKY